jgi:hypothetical protein
VITYNARKYWKRVMFGSLFGICGSFFALLFAVGQACPDNDCTTVESTQLDLLIVGLTFLILLLIISSFVGMVRYLWAVFRNRNTSDLVQDSEPLENVLEPQEMSLEKHFETQIKEPEPLEAELEPQVLQEEIETLAKHNKIKTQLMSAITYIKERDYGQVKAILSKVDHPKIRELLDEFTDNALRNPRFWIVLVSGILEVLDMIGKYEDAKDKRKINQLERRIDLVIQGAKSAKEIKDLFEDLL